MSERKKIVDGNIKISTWQGLYYVNAYDLFWSDTHSIQEDTYYKKKFSRGYSRTAHKSSWLQIGYIFYYKLKKFLR